MPGPSERIRVELTLGTWLAVQSALGAYLDHAAEFEGAEKLEQIRTVANGARLIRKQIGIRSEGD